jgi:hypothetical protein
MTQHSRSRTKVFFHGSEILAISFTKQALAQKLKH